MISSAKSISIFLFIIAAMVLIMATIGAATRLTESGLSIVEWKPVTGAIPPLSDIDWQNEFQKYQSSPQFQKVNAGMTLEEYKTIFWWEWVHRQWGRLIGLVYAAGFGYYLFSGKLKNIFFESSRAKGKKINLLWPMCVMLAIGGLQGVVGWWMVASGLVDRPAVSHYALAAHLGMAVILYLSTLTTAFLLQNARVVDGQEIVSLPPSPFLPLYKHTVAALGLVVLALVWGAFVAGLRAGWVYNTWPLMDGYIAPPDFWFLSPWWLNFFENHGAVQFTHRCIAYVAGTMCISIGLVIFLRRVPAPARGAGYAVAMMGLAQMALGILTVLTQVKIHAAVAHQAGAFILMGLLVKLIVDLRRVGLRDSALAPHILL